MKYVCINSPLIGASGGRCIRSHAAVLYATRQTGNSRFERGGSKSFKSFKSFIQISGELVPVGGPAEPTHDGGDSGGTRSGTRSGTRRGTDNTNTRVVAETTKSRPKTDNEGPRDPTLLRKCKHDFEKGHEQCYPTHCAQGNTRAWRRRGGRQRL